MGDLDKARAAVLIEIAAGLRVANDRLKSNGWFAKYYPATIEALTKMHGVVGSPSNGEGTKP